MNRRNAPQPGGVGESPNDPAALTTDEDPASGVTSPSGDLRGALHEVSNALTVVLGWLDVAATTRGEETVQAIEVARTHARLGHRLAREAIGAKVLGGGLGAQSARELGKTVLLAVQPEAKRRGVTPILSQDPPSDAIVHNATAAIQILTNLLLNGIEFSPSGTQVVLTISAKDGHVYFNVADSGPGIPPERARLLFIAPNSTRAGGAGVGLRHSEALAREKGGELHLVRSSPSAAFELRWPQAVSPKSDSGSYPVISRLKGARVLVLEDDPAVCSLIELGLNARGAEVLPIADVAEFNRMLSDRPLVHAALIDLSPIQGSIGTALGQLRTACPDAPLVLITGSPDGVPAEVAGEFAAWVRKPFEVGEVALALESALAGAPQSER